MIYAVNISIPNPSDNRYETIIVNTYPIIIMGEDGCYKEVLKSSQIKKYIEQNISEIFQPYIVFNIRQINNSKISEFDIKFQDLHIY